MKAALLRSEAVQVPLQDAWRVPYLSHLLGARLKCYYSGEGGEEVDESDRLSCHQLIYMYFIHYICPIYIYIFL